MLSRRYARISWASARKERYIRWCEEIAHTPFSPLDLAEFAIISAHCPMDIAIDGFLATRGAYTLRSIRELLAVSGVMAPGKKGEYIHELRTRVQAGEIKLPSSARDCRTWRERVSIRGLGICKASFAAALIHPLDGDVCCIDTHMAQEYGVAGPRVMSRPKLYKQVESRVRREAAEAGMPVFAYQWAVWDMRRLQTHGQPPCDHSFLWQSGRTHVQERML